LLRLPAAPLRRAAGDLEEELPPGGQRVVPEKALKSGSVFRHASLRVALAGSVGTRASGTTDRHHAMQRRPATAGK
jgi:NAD dependent epimerase/dehydratase family enzyme